MNEAHGFDARRYDRGGRAAARFVVAAKEILSSRPLFARPTQHSCVTKKNEDDDDYLFH
jgi:hypothetical protein